MDEDKAGTESGTVWTEPAPGAESALALAWDRLPEETRRRLATLTPEVLAALQAAFGGASVPPRGAG